MTTPAPATLRPLTTTLASALLVALLSTLSACSQDKPPAMDEEEVATRIQPVGRVHLEKVEAASTGPRSGEEVVKSACSACHSTGAAGAPTIGNKAEWAPRIAKGLDGLLETAKNGLNAMPARGASNASDLELARAIVFMANQSGANFSEPSE